MFFTHLPGQLDAIRANRFIQQTGVGILLSTFSFGHRTACVVVSVMWPNEEEKKTYISYRTAEQSKASQTEPLRPSNLCENWNVGKADLDVVIFYCSPPIQRAIHPT